MQAIKLLVVTIVLAAVGALWGQPPAAQKTPGGGEDKAPSKDSLEQLLAEALRNSPEIQLAEAKLREAEALLRQTRLSIMQKVIEQQSAVETQKSKASFAEANFQRLTKLFEKGMVSSEELVKVKADVEAVKAAMKQAELTLNGLTGKLNVGGFGAAPMVGIPGPGIPGVVAVPGGQALGAFGSGGGALGGGVGGSPFAAEAQARAPHGPMAEKIGKALDKTIKLDKPIEKVPLKDVIALFRAKAGDVPFLPQLQGKDDQPVTLSLTGEMMLGAAFQALQDVVPGLQCFVREYGILILVDGASPDQDAMPLLDFWRNEKHRWRPEMRSTPGAP
jgi:hypothetical protein